MQCAHTHSHWFIALLLGTVLGGGACALAPPAAPTPTESTCPSGFSLTYENFVKPFMERYCTRCHHSELHGSARQGAPLYHDFDSKNGILAVANHVDWYTAAGPASLNTLMPPDGEAPSVEERTQLGEWLACQVQAMPGL